MTPNVSGIYRFAPFELDLAERVLYRAGSPVPLTPKAFDTLVVLVSRHGKIVDKGELLKLVWPETFVEENNLTQNISALRKVFGEDNFIETVPRRGYRFIAPVEVEPAGCAEVVVPPANPPAPVKTTPINLGRWSLVAAVVTCGVAATVYVMDRVRRPAPPVRPVDSLVVLPFVNLTGTPEDQYFSDGLTEELTNAVAHISGLRVIARTTAFQFRNKNLDIRSIARQLNVSAVLEGSVRRQEKKLRVTVQLNDALSGYHIWSQTYDRGEGDVFSIQEDIAGKIARTIRPSDPPALAASSISDREAFNLYLLGRYHRAKPDAASARKAISFFEQAIAKETRYAGAYAGLAECYLKLGQQGVIPPLEAATAAMKAVDRALAIDPNLAEAHTSLAIVHLMVDWNWEAAERQFQRAIALNPNDAAAHHWFSHYHSVFGMSSDSLRESRKALELSPLDLQILGHLVFHYVRARDFRSAIQAGTQALEIDPHSQLVYMFLAMAYEDVGDWEKAIDESPRGRAFPMRNVPCSWPACDLEEQTATGASNVIFSPAAGNPTVCCSRFVRPGWARTNRPSRTWSRHYRNTNPI